MEAEKIEQAMLWRWWQTQHGRAQSGEARAALAANLSKLLAHYGAPARRGPVSLARRRPEFRPVEILKARVPAKNAADFTRNAGAALTAPRPNGTIYLYRFRRRSRPMAARDSWTGESIHAALVVG